MCLPSCWSCGSVLVELVLVFILFFPLSLDFWNTPFISIIYFYVMVHVYLVYLFL